MDINFKATVLLVNASSEALVVLEEALQERYHVQLARSGADAVRLARQPNGPDLILLDSALPDMSGFTVLAELQCHFQSADIPVIFAARADAPGDQLRALREGARDVIAHPLVAPIVRARVDNHLQLRAARAMLKDQRSHLAYLVAERTSALALMQDATIVAMASLAESRDPAIGNHIRRTQHYVAALARALRFHARHAAELTEENIALLFKAAPLHDIGMVGVPDTILLKPGKLTEEEFEIMKRHTVYGRDAIAGVERTLGGSNQFLRYAREICHAHQEYWDGSGYPQGLAGEAIPLSARLMAVADVYDALISERAYRPAFTHETAIELIRQARGEHFDPDVVDAMLAIEERMHTIAQQFQTRNDGIVADGGQF